MKRVAEMKREAETHHCEWKLKRRKRVAAARCNGSGYGDREQSKYESGRN